MSGGDGAITGSEACSPVVLDLNVDPFSPDEIALELVLGEQSSSVQSSRQKLPPRFDPGMSSDSHPQEEILPSDARVFVDLTENSDNHASAMHHRVLIDLVQGNASPSDEPRGPDLMDRDDPNDSIHGFRSSNGHHVACPFEIPVLAPRMRLHSDGGSSSMHSFSTSTSACTRRNGDERLYGLPAISASALHSDASHPTIPGVSSHYDTCPSVASLFAVQRVLDGFVYDDASPNVASRELVDDVSSPLVIPRLSASLLDSETRPPISRNLSLECTSLFATSRDRQYLSHNGTHSTVNGTMQGCRNVCTSPYQLSSNPCEDRRGPSPIPRIRSSFFVDEPRSSSVPFIPVLRERRSPLFPMHRLLNDLPHQGMESSASPFQVPMTENQSLEGLPGDHLGSSGTSPRRLSRRPLRWRRARRRIASLLNQAEVNALSTGGGASTREATGGADDVMPISRMPGFSTPEGAGMSGPVKSPSAPSLHSTEYSHNNVEEANSGNAGAYFDCNICLEMATDPVVSCCGHLFCWPCLHEWLYVHSIARDCPVCKGFLPDNAIIPIYGRGSAQASKRSISSIPCRPSGRRLSSERCQRNENFQERLLRGMSLAAEESRTNTRSERNDVEASSSTVLILDRLRVAQRLQQEYLDRRSRLGQRLMQRQREGIRSHDESIATAEATVNSVFSQTRELEESARHSLEIAANNLAAIRASIEGLRANMQGLVEFVNSVPRGSSIPSSEERRSSSPPIVVEVLSDEEGEALRGDRVPNEDVGGGQLREGSMDSHTEFHTAGRSSGSCNSEPGLSYTRKRRRSD